MASGRIAVGLRRELLDLQLRIGRHAALAVASRQLEHSVVELVEAGQGDELELVAHGAELALEALDRRLVELLLPVEGWRAVIGKHLARESLVHRFGEDAGLLEIGIRRLPPEEIRVAGVGETAGDAV